MCTGSIDGKHIVLQAPSNSGSLYFNYKGSHSVVLLAVCDAQYRFIYILYMCMYNNSALITINFFGKFRFTLVDLGQAGRFSDSGVLSSSTFGKMMMNGSLHFPSPKPLPGTTNPALPFVMVGDEAFPLRENMLRPFPGCNLPGQCYQMSSISLFLLSLFLYN